jgi:hypothetical protein
MDVFLQKFSPAGKILWVKTFGVGASAAQATGIGTDCSGNVLMDGTFTQAINFGQGTLNESGSSGNGDIFLVKLDPSGNCIWSESFGDMYAQMGGSLAVDSFGGPAITGIFFGLLDGMTGGTVNFGGGSLESSVFGVSTYIAKFNTAGKYEWALAGGPPASTAVNSAGYGIAANSTSVVAAGTFQGGTLTFAGEPLTAMSSLDVYLASFVR